jgi:hypothetical protein
MHTINAVVTIIFSFNLFTFNNNPAAEAILEEWARENAHLRPFSGGACALKYHGTGQTAAVNLQNRLADIGIDCIVVPHGTDIHRLHAYYKGAAEIGNISRALHHALQSTRLAA